jgi:endonuclease I
MAAVAWAQGPNNTGEYYKAADGKKGAALKTALFNILRYGYYTFTDEYGEQQTKKYLMVPYKGLYDAYEDTDLRDDGKIWDMYSNTSNYYPSNHTGSYDGEAPVNSKNYNGKTTTKCMYNREHSVPQSWFDGEQEVDTVPYSDLFHVYPTDGFVNNKRSNFPFGKVKTVTWESHNGFSKLGTSATEGYSGTVFEPNDEYKGDFARTYFYMATCHQNIKFTYSGGSDVFESGDKQAYPTLKTWALNMFIEWSHTDEVSDKEYKRNNAVSLLQFNRNPYIDYPGLEQYIWGSMTDVAFSYDNYKVPENYTLYVPGDDPGPDPDDPPIIVPSDGEFVYQRVTKDTDLEEGAGYIIVCEEPSVAMADQNGSTYRNRVSVVMNDGTITTAVNTSGKPYEVTLGTSNGKYTLYDATDKVYLALTSSDNRLHAATSATASTAQWTITISGNNAVIKNAKYTEYSINYNSGSPRFACYKSSSNQKSVQLYKRQPVSTGITTEAAFPVDKAKPNTIIYDLQGRKVGTTVNGTPHLKKGVYIMSGRKVIAN